MTITVRLPFDHRAYSATFPPGNDIEAARYVRARAGYTAIDFDTTDLSDWPLTAAALRVVSSLGMCC